MGGRRLRAIDGASLVVANVVGAGIFTVPGLVASLTGSPGSFIAVWVLGGALALAGALTYAELATRFPAAGGEYVYIRETFGRLPAFLSGWTSFIAGFSGSIAASAVGCAIYAERLVPALAGSRTLVGLAIVAVFTLIALRGVGATRVTVNALTIVLVVGIVVTIGAGMSVAPPATSVVPADGRLSAAISALVPVMFTYSGWNSAAYIANDFETPERAVPRALIAGTLVVVVLYVGMNAVYLRTLSMGPLAAESAVGDAVFATIFGSAGRLVGTLLVLAALASSVGAMIVTGPRIYLQMSRDGLMPEQFARVRASDGIPAWAIVAQSVWSAGLVMTGTFNTIITYTGVAVVLFGAVGVAAVFVVRRRAPDSSHFRMPGYPVVPAAFLAASVLMLGASVRHQPVPALTGLLCVSLGIPVFIWSARSSRQRSSAYEAHPRVLGPEGAETTIERGGPASLRNTRRS